MMRCLVCMLLVLGLITPLYAEAIILDEDFEGATVGTPLTDLGWTGSSEMVISDTLVDQGQSAGYTGTGWPVVSKAFSYSPSASEKYVLSGTLWAAGTTNNYAHVQLKDSGASSRMHAMLGYNELIFGYLLADGTYSADVRVPMALTPMDFKMIVSGSSFDAYWKLNGNSEWSYAGHVDGGVGMADFDQVDLIGHGGYDGGIDSVCLTVVPEPVTAMLCLIGVITLLAMRWYGR